MIVTEHSRLTLKICITTLAVVAITLVVLVAQLMSAIWETELYYEEDKLVVPGYLSVESDYEWSYPWQELGYSNIMDWHDGLLGMSLDSDGIADAAIAVYSSVITDDEKARLYSLEEKMANAPAMSLYNSYLEEFDEILADCESRMPVVTYSSGSGSSSSSGSYISSGSGLTKSGGVYYFNGRRETYYSSNVLYHYRTNEWTVGEDGVYRDADGYIVVAASDLAQGSTIDTSLGEGKVYDSGCANGVTDIYTAW